MDEGWISARAGANLVSLDPGLGNIRALTFGCGSRPLSPLHHAPWLEEPEIQAEPGLLPAERKLSGDFFCAAFGGNDVEEAPTHGWSANSRWTVRETGRCHMTLRLERLICGATLTKTLALSEDSPLLRQEHIIDGGSGGLTVAHHPMIHIAGRATASYSPKRAILTPAAPLEPHRHRLALGAEGQDLRAVPGVEGPVDLTDLPIGTAHEDFVTLVEAPGQPLGWTAVIRDVEDDIVFVLKDPKVLPVTMLWHSNGGRDYSPWNGRHRGVLGIEDGCAAGAAGHRAALGPNPVAATGVATALPLAPGRRHRIAHVLGAIPRPAGWTRVADCAIEGEALRITDISGEARSLPIDPAFLFGP